MTKRDPFGDGLGALPELDLSLMKRQRAPKIVLTRLSGDRRMWVATQAGRSARARTILDVLIKLAGLEKRISDQPRWSS